MKCNTCGSDTAAIIRIRFDRELGKLEQCDRCSSVCARDGAQPDVSLISKGGLQTDMNLCDPKTREPIPFSSKREKAAIMKRLHIRQALSAERHHGSRDMSRTARYQDK